MVFGVALHGAVLKPQLREAISCPDRIASKTDRWKIRTRLLRSRRPVRPNARGTCARPII